MWRGFICIIFTDQFPPAFVLYGSSPSRTFQEGENTRPGLYVLTSLALAINISLVDVGTYISLSFRNRYSPQESVVSGENRPDLSFSLPHRGAAGSESVDRYNRSTRFTLLTNPLWHEEDTDAENPASGEREARRSSSLLQRPATWQLLPASSERILNDTEGAARLLQICREVNKASQSEYRLGPKSWKELFENVDQYGTTTTTFVQNVAVWWFQGV